jgi:hypothetical protein
MLHLGLPSLALLGIGVFGLPTSHPTVDSLKPRDEVTSGYSSTNEKEAIPAEVGHEECLRFLRSNKVTSRAFNYQFSLEQCSVDSTQERYWW